MSAIGNLIPELDDLARHVHLIGDADLSENIRATESLIRHNEEQKSPIVVLLGQELAILERERERRDLPK